MAFNRNSAIDRAVEIIKAGLSSGSIKLKGSASYPNDNVENIQLDGDYVKGMINSITEAIVEAAKKPE